MRGIPILMYHQIDTPPARGTPLRGLVVSPDAFSRQMRVLRFFGVKGLSMHELEPYLLGKKKGRVVGITFDDGYQNNLKNALPVLREFGHTATIFGVSNMIGGSNIWDAGLVQPKPLMNLDDWRIWLDAGMEIGSHTCNHVRLTESDSKSAQDEISRSRVALEAMLNCSVRHFCYPYGQFNSEHIDMVRGSGYISACTTARGRVHSGDDPYSLRRIMVACSTNLMQFLAKTLTPYEDKNR